MDDVQLRPLLPADVPAAHESGWQALREAGTRYGWQMPASDDQAVRTRGEQRVAHLQRTDPDGCWVADRAGAVVGVALALRRGPLWFLSLLTVSAGLQGQGLGRRLLDRVLHTAQGASAGLIVASGDPKALRRYSRAGFALHPGYDARGTVDRALLPRTGGVREGSWAVDGERVDEVARHLRGAPYGPELDFYRESGARLLVADEGFAVLRGGGLAALGAHTVDAATSLLWAALAEGDADVEINPLTFDQQWAIEVLLQARLELTPGESLCTRGVLGPMTPYLPSGAFG